MGVVLLLSCIRYRAIPRLLRIEEAGSDSSRLSSIVERLATRVGSVDPSSGECAAIKLHPNFSGRASQ